jgi:hypothetical protein
MANSSVARSSSARTQNLGEAGTRSGRVIDSEQLRAQFDHWDADVPLSTASVVYAPSFRRGPLRVHNVDDDAAHSNRLVEVAAPSSSAGPQPSVHIARVGRSLRPNIVNVHKPLPKLPVAAADSNCLIGAAAPGPSCVSRKPVDYAPVANYLDDYYGDVDAEPVEAPVVPLPQGLVADQAPSVPASQRNSCDSLGSCADLYLAILNIGLLDESVSSSPSSLVEDDARPQPPRSDSTTSYANNDRGAVSKTHGGALTVANAPVVRRPVFTSHALRRQSTAGRIAIQQIVEYTNASKRSSVATTVCTAWGSGARSIHKVHRSYLTPLAGLLQYFRDQPRMLVARAKAMP